MTAKPVLGRVVRTFLAAPRTARLATLGPDGYPHIVPIWFMRDGDDLVFGTNRGEQKERNASLRRKGAVVIGGEPDVDDAGYMIQGDISVEDDPGLKLSNRLIARYAHGREAASLLEEYARSPVVLLRLRPRRVIRVR